MRIEGLVKVYPGSVCALQGINLEVPRGMFGLLGPNGSGKTTLMRILAGLLEPSGGRILFDGVDVTGRPELVWPRLGYLPQYFGFSPHASGRATLRYLLELKGVDCPRGLAWLVDHLLERVNLEAAAGRSVGGYSGGMRQRLGIAQAIAGDPALVIVDEPTAGLDPEERLRFYRLLAELGAERAVLLSTHLVEDVAMLCPRFAVIRSGRVLATSDTAAARAGLEGAVFEGWGTAAELAGRFAGTVTQERFVEGRAVVRLYAPGGGVPADFRPVPATLEDAYFVIVRGSQTTAAKDAA